MSRCKACDAIMNKFELTRKYAGTTQYVDLCNRCFSTINKDVPVEERQDLLHVDDETSEE